MWGLYVAKENERIVVFRLGRFIRVCGPGFFIMIPLVDKVIKVNLDTYIPGWQALPKGKLEEQVGKLTLSGVIGFSDTRIKRCPMFGLYVAKENERIVVLRRGRFRMVGGPGLWIMIPLVDRVIKVNLNAYFPGWQDLPESELEEQVRKLVLSEV